METVQNWHWNWKCWKSSKFSDAPIRVITDFSWLSIVIFLVGRSIDLKNVIEKIREKTPRYGCIVNKFQSDTDKQMAEMLAVKNSLADIRPPVASESVSKWIVNICVWNQNTVIVDEIWNVWSIFTEMRHKMDFCTGAMSGAPLEEI